MPKQRGTITREQVAAFVHATLKGGIYPGEQIAALIDLVRQNRSDKETFPVLTAEVIKAALGADGQPGIPLPLSQDLTFLEFLRGRQPTFDRGLMGRLLVEILDATEDLRGEAARSRLARQINQQLEQDPAIAKTMSAAIQPTAHTRERIDYRKLARTPDELRDQRAMARSMARNIRRLNALPVVQAIIAALHAREPDVRSSNHDDDLFLMPGMTDEVGVKTTIPGLYVTSNGLRTVTAMTGKFVKPGPTPFESLLEPQDLIEGLALTLRELQKKPLAE